MRFAYSGYAYRHDNSRNMGKTTFERPPLVEVSFGVMFAPLTAMRTAHFGAFWSRVREEFDQTDDKPAVMTDVQEASVTQVGDWFPLPRVWYVQKDGGAILQLQPNRFYFNW